MLDDVIFIFIFLSFLLHSIITLQWPHWSAAVVVKVNQSNEKDGASITWAVIPD